MSHLGGQDSISLIPTNQEELSETPSRVMSAVLDHEAWFNDPDIADPDSAATDNPSEYADWKNIMHHNLLLDLSYFKIKQFEFTILHVLYVSAGDKINILIPNKLADERKKKNHLMKKPVEFIWLEKYHICMIS